MVNKGYVNHASIVQFINITISLADGSRAGLQPHSLKFKKMGKNVMKQS